MTIFSFFLFATTALLTGLIVYAFFRKTGEIFTPWTIFSALSIIDVYIPALIASMTGRKLSAATWMTPIELNTTIEAVLIFIIGHVLFSIGYFSLKTNNKKIITHDINLKIAYFVLIFSTAIYLVSMFFEIKRIGSIAEFISYKLLTRWDPNSSQQLSATEEIIASLSPSMLSIALISIGIIFSHINDPKRSSIIKAILLLVGFALCSTTFFRGTYIKFIIGITSLIIFSKKTRMPHQIFLKKSRDFTKKILFATIIIFILVGSIRQYYSTKEWNNEANQYKNTNLLEHIQEIFSGSGLIGLGSIVASYGKSVDFLYGKTIYDVMLRPIPRSIYPTKPKWYGIDDITRGLGWPDSTQSAVTPQGEFYANFGLVGLALMLVLGFLFSYLTKALTKSTKTQFLYFFIILPSVTTTFWMSFTGLMNSLLTLPIIILAITPIFKKRETYASKKIT